jgi:hypothetical protein
LEAAVEEVQPLLEVMLLVVAVQVALTKVEVVELEVL